MAANTNNSVPHSQPIPIQNAHRSRSHSVSDSSSSSEESCSPISPTNSPLTGNAARVAPVSPGTTPIFNYFLSQSPKSPTGTFPFRRGFGSAVIEDESESDFTSPSKHRRASTTAWPSTDRFPAQSPPAPAPGQQDRAAGLLRRLSLGGAALRPQVPQIKTGMPTTTTGRVPPNTPAVEQAPSPSSRKARRANTLAPGSQRPKRAPSPMGERILTGHFDGFN